MSFFEFSCYGGWLFPVLHACFIFYDFLTIFVSAAFVL